MSLHDEARLRRGQAALVGKPLSEMTDDELRSEGASVGRAIASVQSTDDPGEAYAQMERDLCDRDRAIDAEIKRREAAR